MTGDTPADADALILVTSDALAAPPELPGVALMRFSDWRERLVDVSGDGAAPVLALADMAVLGLCLNTEEAALATGGDAALAALVAAAEIPVRDLGAAPEAEAVRAAGWALVLARYAALRSEAASGRAAQAELRQQHMQLQDDFAAFETWVWDAFAPNHKLARAWPPTAATIALGAATGPVEQPLPAPSRGFIAVDVHIAEAAPEGGVLTFRLARPAGPDLAGPLDLAVPEGASGWLRLTLPRAGGGPAEDAVLVLGYAAPGGASLALSRAPESPFADYRAAQGGAALPAPLALRVYQTLPRLPAPPEHDPRQPLPADGETRLIRPRDLGEIRQLPYARGKVRRALRSYPDAPKVAYREETAAFLVQPSAARPVAAIVPGFEAQGLRQLRGIVQLRRHDTMETAFAIGAAPAGTIRSAEEALGAIGDWVHLLPGEWGEVWFEPPEPLSGALDLLLVTAMPNMPFNTNAEALFHGFRVTCEADERRGRAET